MSSMTKTKAKSKAARRRNKISLAGGQSVEARPTGKDRRHTNQPKEDVRKPVLSKRARDMGISKIDDANDPVLGHDMGKCINAITGGNAQIIETWEELSASRRNYLSRYIGQTGEPRGATIAMVPGKMETDPSLRIDPRTVEEKAEKAKSSWQAWEARINALPAPQLKGAIRGVLNGFMGEATLWRDQAPTTTGKVAVEALRHLSK